MLKMQQWAEIDSAFDFNFRPQILYGLKNKQPKMCAHILDAVLGPIVNTKGRVITNFQIVVSM